MTTGMIALTAINNSLNYVMSAITNTQWQQIMELGQQVDDIVFEERLATVSPEDCAAILYTVRYY